jgi:putative transposase
MARPLRLEYPGSLWHITDRGNDRRDIVRDENDRKRFIDLLAKAAKDFHWLLYAYALMTNHYHLIIELTRESLSRGMQWLNGEYSRSFNKRHARTGHLFQPRFGSHLVERESYFLEVLRYVVLNPIRANMVGHPRDYRWTSYPATVGEVDTPLWLATNRVLPAFGPTIEIARREYRSFVEAGIAGTRRPWDLAVGGMYLGSELWVQNIKEKIDAKPRSDEFPTAHIAPRAREVSMANVISSVSAALMVDEIMIRHGRGGVPRMICAWVGRREALLDLRSIAAALRIRSAAQVSKLVAACEQKMNDVEHRTLVDRCVAALQ